MAHSPTQAQAARLALIQQITAAATNASDAAGIWSSAAEAVRALIPGFELHVLRAGRAGFSRFDGAASVPPPPPITSLHRRTLEAGSAVAVADVARDARTTPKQEAWHRAGIRAVLDVPVTLPRGEHLAGILRLTAPEPTAWPETTCVLLEDAARHTGVGLQLVATLQPDEPLPAIALPRHDVHEHLNLALDAADMGLWVWELEAETVHWSYNLADTLGISADLFDGTIESYRAMVHPDDREMIQQDFAAALQTGAFATEHRLIRPDGSIVWVSSVGYAKYDTAGRPTQLVGTSRNITHRKRTEDELQESKRRLSLALNAAQLGLWDFDYPTQTNTVDAGWAALLGYELAEIESTADFFWRHIHPDDAAQAEVSLVPDDDQGDSYLSAEMRMRHKEGSWRWILSLGQVVQWNEDGTPRRAVGIHLDITERKEGEEALRRAKDEAEEMSRLRSTFLANMSHEIRTPLTAVIGFASILVAEVPEAKRELAEYIERAGKRLLATLNSVLDLSMLESGNLKLMPELIDLNAEVAAKAELLQPLAKDRGITLAVHTPEAPCPLLLDRSCLDRILNNLIGNAIKFTPQGAVTISVRPTPGSVTILVEDTGIGIDEAFLPNLFAAFEQESTGMTRSYEGNGLGLTITHRLVELLGGQIEVTSHKGQGTTFAIHLPRSENGEALLPASFLVAPVRPETSCRMLVLDDDPAVPELLRHLLPNACHLAAFRSADEALVQATETRFDVVLLDINLGDGRSGIEVLQALRADPAYEHVPCIAVTAYALPGDEQRFLDCGFDAYLSKPFTRDHLYKILADTLEQAPPTLSPR